MAHWTRDQLLVALNLYCQLSFGQFDRRTPLIIETAKLIHRTPSALAMKLANLASLDPAITQSGRSGLRGASVLDKALWQEFQHEPDRVALESQEAMDQLAQQSTFLNALSSQSGVAETPADYSATNTTATVAVRRKQYFFRKSVLSSYESRCCMSGIRHPQLLVASHIVPWSKDEQNRLNPANGLCLSALHDRAFDLGLITVTPDFHIRVSHALHETEDSTLASEYLLGLEGKEISLPHKFAPHSTFLEFHNHHIFQH